MAIKTVDMNRLAAMTGNVFESVSILSKRSRQISTNIKNELDDKLAYFEGFEQELEDPRFQEEQAKVSLEYEVKPEPTEMAIDEMIVGDVYFRSLRQKTHRICSRPFYRSRTAGGAAAMQPPRFFCIQQFDRMAHHGFPFARHIDLDGLGHRHVCCSAFQDGALWATC